MKEHKVWTKFQLTIRRNTGVEILSVGVKPAEGGCNGCMFAYRYYDYSCGYGFLCNGCKAGGHINARCKADIRSDKADIIYRKLSTK